MSSVRIDASAWADPRFTMLAKRCNLGSSKDALGRTAAVWSYATERQAYALPVEIVDALGEVDGFAAHLVACHLAETQADGQVRLHGLKGRIEWLQAKRDAASKGGKRSGSSRKAVRKPSAQAVGAPPANPLSLALSLSPVLSGEIATPAESPTPQARKQHPDFRQFTATFQALFATHAGANPTWDAKNRTTADRLLKSHGLDECLKRSRRMFEHPPDWLKPPFTIGTLSANFDQFVDVAGANGASDLPAWIVAGPGAMSR